MVHNLAVLIGFPMGGVLVAAGALIMGRAEWVGFHARASAERQKLTAEQREEFFARVLSIQRRLLRDLAVAAVVIGLVIGLWGGLLS